MSRQTAPHHLQIALSIHLLVVLETRSRHLVQVECARRVRVRVDPGQHARHVADQNWRCIPRRGRPRGCHLPARVEGRSIGEHAHQPDERPAPSAGRNMGATTAAKGRVGRRARAGPPAPSSRSPRMPRGCPEGHRRQPLLIPAESAALRVADDEDENTAVTATSTRSWRARTHSRVRAAAQQPAPHHREPAQHMGQRLGAPSDAVFNHTYESGKGRGPHQVAQ